MKDDLVSLVSLAGGKSRQVGSGYLVRAGIVLTAAHVIRKGPLTSLAADFVHRADQGEPVGCERELWSSETLDVALVALTSAVEPAHRTIVANTRPTLDVDCSTIGFPGRGLAGEVEDSRYTGRINDLPSGELELLLVGVPEAWGGLSGGPVFVGSELVGVVVSQRSGYKHGDKIRAAATAAFVGDAEVRRILADPHLAKSEEELVRGLLSALAGKASLADRLAEALECEAKAIPETLSQSSAEHIAQVFYSIWNEPEGPSRSSILEVLRWALPLAHEWSSLALLLSDPGIPCGLQANDPAGVELPRARHEARPANLDALRQPTGECVQILIDDRATLGFDMTDDGLVERVLRGLAKRLAQPGEGPLDGVAAGIEKAIFSRQRRGRLGPPAPWLLFADYHDKFGGKSDGAAHEIKKRLPSLVVIVARGSNKASEFYVDVLVGDIVRDMLAAEREARESEESP